MENNETFRFTYCAAQQQEVVRIRKKYLPPQEDKMAQLRRLDSSASRKAQIWALTLGILGCLVMGAGMSLVMTELGAQLPMAVGICLGIAGMLLAGLAYPVYTRLLTKERQRLAPEILRLTDELLK